MDMIKVNVIDQDQHGYSTAVYLNPALIGAVYKPHDMADNRTLVVMADGTRVEVEYTLDDLLARLGQV